MNGTSASAPMISGVVAHLIDAYPNLTTADALYLLMKSAWIPSAAMTSSTSLPVSFSTGNPPNVIKHQGSFQIPSDMAATGIQFIHKVTNDAGPKFSTDYGFGIPDIEKAMTLAANYTPGKMISSSPIVVNAAPLLRVPAKTCNTFTLSAPSNNSKIWSINMGLKAMSENGTSTARFWHYRLKHGNTKIDVWRPRFCVTLAGAFQENSDNCYLANQTSLNQKTKIYTFMDQTVGGNYEVEFCNYSNVAATIQNAKLEIYTH
jgi:hypothetical protein